MKKIIIILILLPFFTKAQVPTLSADTTYRAKAVKAGTLVVDNDVYFSGLKTSAIDSMLSTDAFGRLILKKVATSEGATGPTGATGATGPAGPQGIQGVSGTNGAVGATGSQGIQGIQGATGATGPTGANGTGSVTSFDKIDGYGIISSVTNPTTTPVHTVAVDTTTATGVVSKDRLLNYANRVQQRNAVIFTGTNGIQKTDSSKLSWDGNTLSLNKDLATGSTTLQMDAGRVQVIAGFNGLNINVGSGTAGGGTYDASKGITFQNRGNNLFGLTTSATTGGFNLATIYGRLKVNDAPVGAGTKALRIDALGNITKADTTAEYEIIEVSTSGAVTTVVKTVSIEVASIDRYEVECVAMGFDGSTGFQGIKTRTFFVPIATTTVTSGNTIITEANQYFGAAITTATFQLVNTTGTTVQLQAIGQAGINISWKFYIRRNVKIILP
jgi:hypothetical protein